MKVFHVTNAVGWSGGMEQISVLVEALKKQNHENVIVCPPDSGLTEKFHNSGITVEPLPMFQDYDLISAWKLRRLVQRYSPGIVHAHHAIAHAVALLALTGTKKPALVVSRRVSFPPRKNPFSRWKYRSSRIDRYVVVSESVKQTLVQGGVDASKIHVIYSAVNLKKFSPRKPDERLKADLHIPSDYAVVGKLANFSLWKGQHIFLAAAKKCLEKNPKIIFVLVGKGTETLTGQVKELGIADSIRLLGFRKDVPEILSILDVSVNCAVEGEGLSGAMRESLSMEIPVVASDVAGNREIVKDGETGFLVPRNDPDSLAQKILHALQNRPQAKTLAQKGRRWVMENASLEKMTENFLNLYGGL